MSFLDQFRLDGKVALVTGGSRGLGLEMARALSDAGARVALLGRRDLYLQQALREIPDALGVLADVAEEASLRTAIHTVQEELGEIDILVNAAGMAWGAPTLDFPLDKWRAIMAVNVEGSYHACKLVAPAMQRRGYGKIINIASVVAHVGEPPEVLDAVAYNASKGAVVALTRDLAAKWGRHGIRVNAISPGYFPTKMTHGMLEHAEAAIAERTALGRIGQAGELGGAALYLASPASDYVTGHVLRVDGGYTS